MPDSAPLTQFVFVYGTLKRGFPNHHLMPKAAFVGPCGTFDKIPLVIAGPWYTPTLIPESGGHKVTGELYGVDDAGLAYLDDLEGVGRPHGFDRIQLEVHLADSSTVASAYTKPRDRIDIIHSEPLAEYHLDPRYVPGDQRDQPNSGFGAKGLR
jgi:gamma-glutamylaminecyclotransferase